jgi:hypothetical protein
MDSIFAVILGSVVSGTAAGFAAYLAIRVDLAVVKHRVQRSEEDIKALAVNVGDAHERIDGLSRSRMKTI